MKMTDEQEVSIEYMQYREMERECNKDFYNNVIKNVHVGTSLQSVLRRHGLK